MVRRQRRPPAFGVGLPDRACPTRQRWTGMAPAELLLQHGCLSRSTAEHGAPLTKGRPACSWGDQSFRFDSQSIQALPASFPGACAGTSPRSLLASSEEGPMQLMKAQPTFATMKQDLDRVFGRFFEPTFWPLGNPPRPPELVWEPILDFSET